MAYNKQIEKLRGARFTLEEQLMAVEFASLNVETMRTMRMGAHTMRRLHNNMYVRRFLALENASHLISPM